MQKRRYVNDNVHGLIRCTNLESSIMLQTLFSRLHGVYQNSVAYLTWPSNRNQRYEHSIGTMKLAGDMLFAAIANASPDDRRDFLDAACEEIKDFVGDVKGSLIDSTYQKAQKFFEDAAVLWEQEGRILSNEAVGELLAKPIDAPLPDFSWRLVPGEVQSEQVGTCYLLVQAIRVVGMIHDIGHPPFSHAVEHALKKLALDAADISENEAAEKFCDMMRDLDAIADKTHEAMGSVLTDMLFKSVIERLHENHVLYAPLILEYHIVARIVDRILKEEGVLGGLHEVVSSSVDADRLDFVRRDSLSSGLGLETVQYPRLVDGLRMFALRGADGEVVGCFFAQPVKAINSIEAFLVQRYQNYDTIVWHHRVVKSEALLGKTISELGLRSLRGGMVQAPNRHLPSDISGLWIPFMSMERNGLAANKHLFGQWNDAWLMTTLAGEYIDLCLGAESGALKPNEELVRGRLAELLYSERHYVSLVKRYGDIEGITESFDAALSLDGEGSHAMREALERLSQTEIGDNPPDDARNETDASPSEQAFIDLLPSESDAKSDRSRRNPLIRLRDEFDAYNVKAGGFASFKELIDSIVDSYRDEVSAAHPVLDMLVVHRSLDNGVGKNTRLYKPDGTLVSLERLSNIQGRLALEERTRPPFYVYVRFEDGLTMSPEDEEHLREDFVAWMGKEIARWYTEQYVMFKSKVSE